MGGNFIDPGLECKIRLRNEFPSIAFFEDYDVLIGLLNRDTMTT